MKNFNSFFNQLTAMPKRLAMVLTVLFTLGVGSMLGAALGDGYEKVTNISNLATGDRVILYCDDYWIYVQRRSDLAAYCRTVCN